VSSAVLPPGGGHGRTIPAKRPVGVPRGVAARLILETAICNPSATSQNYPSNSPLSSANRRL